MTDPGEQHGLPPGQLDPRALGRAETSRGVPPAPETPSNPYADHATTGPNPYADDATTGPNPYADQPSAPERHPASVVVGIVLILVGGYLGLGALGLVGGALDAVATRGWVGATGMLLHIGVRLVIATVFIGGGIGAVSGKLRSSD